MKKLTLIWYYAISHCNLMVAKRCLGMAGKHISDEDSKLFRYWSKLSLYFLSKCTIYQQKFDQVKVS